MVVIIERFSEPPDNHGRGDDRLQPKLLRFSTAAFDLSAGLRSWKGFTSERLYEWRVLLSIVVFRVVVGGNIRITTL
jgi:hypothetical protein